MLLGPVVADRLGAHAVRSSDGFDVTNPVDGTRYQVRPTSISIRSPGGQVSTEPMIQYAARRPFLTAAVLIIIAFVIAVCIFIWWRRPDNYFSSSLPSGALWFAHGGVRKRLIVSLNRNLPGG